MTSANVVGYKNEAARDNFNYITPVFRPIAGMIGEDNNEIPLNEIQLSADAGVACNLQILDDQGGKAYQYAWIPVSYKGNTTTKYKSLVWPSHSVNGIWAVSEGKNLAAHYVNPENATEDPTTPSTVKVGEGVQINAYEGNTINNAGQVGEETVEIMTRDARDNFNYFGNPFAADIPFHYIQLSSDAGVACNLQLLDEQGGKAYQYAWIPVSYKGNTTTKYKSLVWPTDVENLNGIWAVSEGKNLAAHYVNPENATEDPTTPARVSAGQCVQINAYEGNKFWVICPYDL